MSWGDEKDLFRNEKTGQGYVTEGGEEGKKEKVSDAERRREQCGGRMMCRARADKAEPGSRRGAGCLSAIQPVSYSVTYSVG